MISVQDALMVVPLCLVVGFIAGLAVQKARDNYKWRNIPPYILRCVADFRERKWESDGKESHEPNCGL